MAAKALNRLCVPNMFRRTCVNIIREQSTFPQGQPLNEAAKVSTAPILTQCHGNKICIKNNPKNLLDFASTDILGFQNNVKFIEEQLNAMQSKKLLRNHRQTWMAMDIHRDLETILAKLHGADDAVILSTSLADTTRLWMDRLTERDTIFVDSHDLHMSDHVRLSPAQKVVYSKTNLQELKKSIELNSEGHHIIMVENKSVSPDLESLRAICELASSCGAIVVYNDPHGFTLMQHLIVNDSKTHQTLKEPLVINSSLDLLTGPGGKVSYITGPSDFIKLLRHLVDNKDTVLAQPTIVTVMQSLKVLPEFAGNAWTTLLHSLSLKSSLQKIGYSVQGSGFHLIIPVTCREGVYVIRDELQEHGIHVGTHISQNSSPDGIGVNLTTSHKEEDILTISNAFEQIYHKHKDLFTSSISNFQNMDIQSHQVNDVQTAIATRIRSNTLN